MIEIVIEIDEIDRAGASDRAGDRDSDRAGDGDIDRAAESDTVMCW